MYQWYFTRGIFSLLVIFLVGIRNASAAELYFGAMATSQTTGRPFEIGVFLNTQGDTINALEGTVLLPSIFQLVDIRDGNSVISFWIERPKKEDEGIRFSGVIPGGFQGSKAYLFSLIVVGNSATRASVSATNLQVLEHDGEGTPVKTTVAPLILSLRTDAEGEGYLPPKDNDPPETFVQQVGHDPSLYGGRWFLVFAAHDKGSGIDRYEVKEERWFFSSWIVSESPYVLTDQKLRHAISVKAIDRSGNARIVKIPAPSPLPFYRNPWTYGILLAVLIVGRVLSTLWKQKQKQSRSRS